MIRRTIELAARLLAILVPLCLSPLSFSPLTVMADSAFVPAAPSGLTVRLGKAGPTIARGAWVARARVRMEFQARVSGNQTLTPEVEIEPAGIAFTGQPNFTGAPVRRNGMAAVWVDGLQNGGRYHWQAQFIDSAGSASAWTSFAAGSQGPDFSVDRTTPSRPVVRSPTDPKESVWYNSKRVFLTWKSFDAVSGIAGYTYAVQRQPHVIPPGSITARNYLRLTSLQDGVWFLALRAVDRAGNWSPTATFRVQIDRQPPAVVWLSPKRMAFNPYRGPIAVQFKLTKDAAVHLDLYRVGDKKPTVTYTYLHVPGGRVTTVAWTGKVKDGAPVRAGYYFFSLRAEDRASNVTRVSLGGFDVNPQKPFMTPAGVALWPDSGKHIIVSLSHETLYAYDGTHLVVQTLVTTGNPNLPTPAGTYHIMAKYHPYMFRSPWPPGSPYWYPDSLSNYAMLFRDGGYFLHDAPWRSVFGPGTNGAGQPGTNYGGTHGCVNIPPGPTLTLWNWAPIGTEVDVVP